MLDPYWPLFNPLVRNILSIVFGAILIAGIGVLIFNLVMLAISHRRIGPLLGITISLLVMGISVRWDWFVLIVSEIMGGMVQYVGYYLYMMVYEWLAQNTLTLPAILL